MKIGFVSHSGLQSFIKHISDSYECYAPQKSFEKYHLKKVEDISSIELFGIRTEEPISSFFFPPREKLATNEATNANKAILGLKGCDISALKILDWVFLKGAFIDPYYSLKRSGTLIVSTDCTDFSENCFCSLIGEKPYPEDGFDINISLTKDGYLLSAGSELGEELLIRQHIHDATSAQIEEMKFERAELKESQYRNLKEKGFSFNYLSLDYVIKNGKNSQVWDEESKKCVECGACTFVCPTCHCFLLSPDAEGYFSKIRNWDSCLYYGFARVAGGANPRGKLRDRLRNRFVKKFVFFPEVLDRLGCTGCGRCVEACLGNIDIRKVLEEVSSEKSISI